MKIVHEIIHLIRENQSFLVCAHVNPDGDSIGSELSLALFLQKMAKNVTVYNRDGTPMIYRFLPHSELIIHQLPKEKGFDVSFILDCSTFERVGKEFERYGRKGKVIVIDHHQSQNACGDINWIDPKASATGELLYRLIQRMGGITTEIATNLYTAILTDTGSFQFPNTTEKAFEIASGLVRAGASPTMIAQNIYENYSETRFRLLALVLNTLQVDNGVASMVLSRRMLRKTRASSDMTEGFINLPRSIFGVKAAVLFREISPSLYKVSLRSKGPLNVAQIASRFEGGGHPNAAGCQVRGDLDKVQKVIHGALKVAERALERD